MTKKRILVLGGTGFLGSSFIDSLLKKDYEIHTLIYDDGFMFENDNLIKHWGDICKEKSLQNVFNGIDVVVNLTGQIAPATNYYDLNTVGVLNILNNCVQHHVKKIVFSSSVKVYGSAKKCNETTTPAPLSQEGIMKLVAEKLHHYYSEKYKIPVVCLRFSNLYGPRMKKGVLFNFIQGLIKKGEITVNGDGNQKRSFVYIDDAVSVLTNAVEYPCSGFEVFNISNNKTITINKLLELVQKNLGTSGAVHYDYSQKTEESYGIIEIQKAKHNLQFKLQIRLEEGVAITSKALQKTIDN